MRLTDLLHDGGTRADGAIAAQLDIAGLTSDSRQVRPGYLFAALPGARTDGRRFIDDALARGAAAVLAPPGEGMEFRDHRVPFLVDDNPRRLFALMAARFFGRQPHTVAAVTGTNGKTSVCHFLCQIWTRLGLRAATLGTLGVHGAGFDVPGTLTTPDPVDLHRTLRDLADADVAFLAMEASSHGLDQFRLDGVRVTAAAFTNLSRDHLDYHQTMESYLAAKMGLFDRVMAEGGVAVLNADAAYMDAVESVARARHHRIIAYGQAGHDIRLRAAEPTEEGQRMRIAVDGETYDLLLPLVGSFQVDNALCALGLAFACGADREAAIAALESLEGAPGRMQRIGAKGNGAAVFVDYAHTPDALANTLRSLRPHTRGRLAVVFGCGGDRDAGKRPEMGDIAERLADLVIVSDDNPRSEDAAVIRRQILAACPGAREIGDRRQAILEAVAALHPGDVLVVAGKGHEQGQIVGETVLPFDDAAVVGAALEGDAA